LVAAGKIKTSGGQAAAEKSCGRKFASVLSNQNPQRLARRWF